jgi:hypothetical protein
MLVNKLLLQIRDYAISFEDNNYFYEKDFTDQLEMATSEIFSKLACILRKERNYKHIIDRLKTDPEFDQTVKDSYTLLQLVTCSHVINIFSVNNMVSLIIIISIITILNFYIKNSTDFFNKMNIIKNCILTCKIELPRFNDLVCNKFNTIFLNLVILEKTIIEARNAIMREIFSMDYKKQCIKDFMSHIEQTLKELYEGTIEFLLEKQEKKIKLLIIHTNDYFRWLIGKIKKIAACLIARYNGTIEHSSEINNSSMDFDLESQFNRESTCMVISTWLAAKWQLYFYNYKFPELEEQDDDLLTSNSFHDIIRERSASYNKLRL